MTITKIETAGKKRVNVYIDDAFAFWLPPKDIILYALNESEPITETMYDRIIEESVFYRAKLKALTLLQHADRTEMELRNRLTRESYQADVIDRTMAYVKSFHYIDDLRYAMSYIRSRSLSKSKKQILMELSKKGISQDTIEKAYIELSELEGESIDPEISAIKKIISKKCSNINELTKEEKLKLFASLYRKGFSADNIRKVCSISEYE